jgi:hypothetical protein
MRKSGAADSERRGSHALQAVDTRSRRDARVCVAACEAASRRRSKLALSSSRERCTTGSFSRSGSRALRPEAVAASGEADDREQTAMRGGAPKGRAWRPQAACSPAAARSAARAPAAPSRQACRRGVRGGARIRRAPRAQRAAQSRMGRCHAQPLPSTTPARRSPTALPRLKRAHCSTCDDWRGAACSAASGCRSARLTSGSSSAARRACSSSKMSRLWKSSMASVRKPCAAVRV